MEAVIYRRVSTEDQNTDRQEYELNKYALGNDIKVLKTFTENITGMSKQQDRKSFDEMTTFIEANSVKLVLVHSISRLGRNLRNGLNIIQDFKDKEINIFFYNESIYTITSDPSKQLQLNVLSSVAEYERTTILNNTISGTYNSIRKGGVGSGSIKQFGYKKEAGKLLIDEAEAAAIKDICGKYLVEGWSVKAIADYMNELGIQTRYKKLIDAGTITYKRPSKLIWNDGTVARLLHKKLLTGFRVYGKVELQDEKLRIIEDSTFEAIQIKMNQKRKTQANAQKYEAILKGVVFCGHCGAALIMEKGANGLSNHYKCYNKFRIKEGCKNARMIDIDLLNNVVYKLTKDFKVDAKDILKKINDNTSKIDRNTNTINQIDKELKIENDSKSRLVDLYMSNRIDLKIYDSKLMESEGKTEELLKRKETIILNNNKLKTEIEIMNSKKTVDLQNPLIFKENIKNLVQGITVETMNKEDIKHHNNIVAEYLGESEHVELPIFSKRDIYYLVDIKMFDDITHYWYHVNNMKNDIEKIIEIERK